MVVHNMTIELINRELLTQELLNRYNKISYLINEGVA